jgi:hypothetical protein
MLDDELDRESDDVLSTARSALTRASGASMLDEELERLFELALIVARTEARLDDDDERLREDACSVETKLSVAGSATSTLEELDDNHILDVRFVEIAVVT